MSCFERDAIREVVVGQIFVRFKVPRYSIKV